MPSENKIKLQRLYYTSCKAYKNHFKEGVGYNVLTASEKTATRERLKEILAFSSEPIRFGAKEDYTFAFTWSRDPLIGGVFCASFPARDDAGRASQFRNVVYGIQKNSLTLCECVEVYWDKERIRDVCERQSVWPDDADEPNEKKEPVLLETLRDSLKEIEAQKREEFWNKLKNDANWKKTFSALLDAYFKRKNRESRIFLVASAENVALAIWGLARLLPESALSDVSFAIRESRLYARRTIIGLDKELQKKEIAELEAKIKDGFSDDAMIFEDGKTIGVTLESEDRLSFLTDVESSNDWEDFFENIDDKRKDFDAFTGKYFKDDPSFSSFLPIEQRDVLSYFHQITSKEKESVEDVFNVINGNKYEYRSQFKNYVANKFDDYWNCAKKWDDPKFALTLWRCVYSKKSKVFIGRFINFALSCQRQNSIDYLKIFCDEKSFEEYIDKLDDSELLAAFANALWKRFVKDDLLSDEIERQERIKNVLSKVFVNNVKRRNNDVDNLKKLYDWSGKDKFVFFRDVFEKCCKDKTNWKDDSINYVVNKMEEFCFGDNMVKNLSADSCSICVLCSDTSPIFWYLFEPISSYFKEQDEKVQFDFFQYFNILYKKLPKIRSDELDGFRSNGEEIRNYKKRNGNYGQICIAFSELIGKYNKLLELEQGFLKDKQDESFSRVRKSCDEILQSVGLVAGNSKTFLAEVPECELKKSLQDSFNDVVSVNSERIYHKLWEVLCSWRKNINDDYSELIREYNGIYEKKRTTYYHFLNYFHNVVKNSEKGTLELANLSLGNTTEISNVNRLCELLKNKVVWERFGKDFKKTLKIGGKHVSFLQKVDCFNENLLRNPLELKDSEPKQLHEGTIARLNDPLSKPKEDGTSMKDLLQNEYALGLIIYSIITSLLLLVGTIYVLGGNSGASNAEGGKTDALNTGNGGSNAGAAGEGGDGKGDSEVSGDVNHIVDQFISWVDSYHSNDFVKAKNDVMNLEAYQFSSKSNKVKKLLEVAKILETEADKKKDKIKGDNSGGNEAPSNNGDGN